MRTQKTILNLVYALGSSLLLMLLGFATRRLLVFNFGNDITAASQVVDKLFNFFSIAEFGVGSVISYRLYEQIAAKDIEKISKYMSMYKWAYRAVGVVICVLAGIGAWFVLDWLRRLGPAGEAEGENRAATLWGCVSLAAALAVNNAGIGVAAGVSGIAPGWAALANFLVTLAALPLGRALGDKLAGRLLGKYALPLSGALLVLLGIWEAVG